MCLTVILESIKPMNLFELQKSSVYEELFVFNCFLRGPENYLLFRESEMRKPSCENTRDILLWLSNLCYNGNMKKYIFINKQFELIEFSLNLSFGRET